MYVCPECGKKSEKREEHLKHLMTHKGYEYIETRWLLGLYR